MTDGDIKRLFSTFHNLNLLILIQNLERDLVCIKNWLERGRLCPIAHGWVGDFSNSRMEASRRKEELLVVGDAALTIPEDLQISSILDRLLWAGLHGYELKLGHDFYHWWDGFNLMDQQSRRDLLSSILQQIHRERLEDADAVQAVLELNRRSQVVEEAEVLA